MSPKNPHRQQRKVPLNDWSCHKRVISTTAILSRHEVIRKRFVRTRLIDSLCQRGHKQSPRLRSTSSCGPHFPITLGPYMSVVKGYTVLLGDSRIEVRLHGEQRFVNRPQVKEKGGEDVVEDSVGGWEVTCEKGMVSRGVDG